MVHSVPPPFTKPTRFQPGGSAGFKMHCPTMGSRAVTASSVSPTTDGGTYPSEKRRLRPARSALNPAPSCSGAS